MKYFEYFEHTSDSLFWGIDKYTKEASTQCGLWFFLGERNGQTQFASRTDVTNRQDMIFHLIIPFGSLLALLEK